MRPCRLLPAICALWVLAAVPAAQARIVGLDILSTEPAFGGQEFGSAGAYQHIRALAHGEIDPADPHNAIIQDLALAPRNAHGMVEYTTEVELLRPADLARGNQMRLFEVANRGNKLAFGNFNADVPAGIGPRNGLSGAGDGWLLREGYSLVWFGWEMDVLPGLNHILMQPVVAHHADGAPVTGVVRSEITTIAPTTSLPISSSWQVAAFPTDAYPAATLDNHAPQEGGFVPTLTVRAHEQAPRVPIANTEWSFGSCAAGHAAVPDARRLCYPAGFQPGRLYELIYRAKDPTVAGIGFAVPRDLAAFFQDTQGAANPLYRQGTRSILMGTSQSGRMVRSFLQLGFNETEAGARAFDGAYPHIGGGLMPLNVRFAQPGRAWGEQTDHLYPAYDFPFTYGAVFDPLTLRHAGLLDRCKATGTCPLIFHVATPLEIWEGRQSLGFTDPLGRFDLPDPANVRSYIMASTQHGAAALPLPTQPPFGNCQQQPNPNPQTWTMRALLRDFTLWVRDGVLPPASVVPHIADATLVAPDQVHLPPIPANSYGGVPRIAVPPERVANTLHVLNYGKLWRAADGSGIITIEPPRVGAASYGVLVPQVDADGNDIAGIRSVFLQVPIGTYTGWNLGRADRFEGGMCNLQGSFIPFAATRAERDAVGDPRPSLAERYPSAADYVAAFRAAADRLVAQRLLLPEDAAMLVAKATREGIRSGP